MAERMGRPLKFETVEELQKNIDEYFVYCDKTIIKKILNKNQEIIAEISKPYTITGLACHLKTSRQTLINYEDRPEFFDTIKEAKTKIESHYEENALIGDSNATFSIFTLKNNFDWKDKTEQTVEQSITFVGEEDKVKSQEAINILLNDNTRNP